MNVLSHHRFDILHPSRLDKIKIFKIFLYALKLPIDKYFSLRSAFNMYYMLQFIKRKLLEPKIVILQSKCHQKNHASLRTTRGYIKMRERKTMKEVSERTIRSFES